VLLRRENMFDVEWDVNNMTKGDIDVGYLKKGNQKRYVRYHK